MRSGKKYRQRTQQQSVSQSHVNILARQRFLFPLPPSSWKSNDISSAVQFSFESPGHPTELAYTHTDTKNPADELLLSVPSCKIEKNRTTTTTTTTSLRKNSPRPCTDIVRSHIHFFRVVASRSLSPAISRMYLPARQTEARVYIYIRIHLKGPSLSLSPSLSRSLALSLSRSLSLPLVGFTIRHGVEG